MWRRIGIGFIALIATLLLTMLALQVLLTLYRLNVDVPMNKEIFLLVMAGEFTFFYHWMMKLSK